MSLDYTGGCVNFRDVGEWLNIIAGRKVMPMRRLLRCGKLNFVTRADQISTSNDFEKYQTARREVRDWLRRVIQVFEDQQLRYPVLVHCTSGKDRTGVVVAVLLRVLEVPDDLIIGEYLLSDGDVRASLLRQSLDGVGKGTSLSKYFSRIDLDRVRRNLLAEQAIN